MGVSALAKTRTPREADTLTVFKVAWAVHRIPEGALAPKDAKKNTAVAGTLEDMLLTRHRLGARDGGKRGRDERRDRLGVIAQFALATHESERHNEHAQSPGVESAAAQAHVTAGQISMVSFVSTKSLTRMATEIATTLRVVASPTPWVPPRVMKP